MSSAAASALPPGHRRCRAADRFRRPPRAARPADARRTRTRRPPETADRTGRTRIRIRADPTGRPMTAERTSRPTRPAPHRKGADT